MELSVSEGWKVWLSSISFLEDGFISSIYHVVCEVCTYLFNLMNAFNETVPEHDEIFTSGERDGFVKLIVN
jgi:hypothetical protein